LAASCASPIVSGGNNSNSGSATGGGTTSTLKAHFLVRSVGPSDSSGVDGDLYLDQSTTNLYVKVVGHWTLVSTLKGTAGADGHGWTVGSGAPSSTLGNDGDLYLDTDTTQAYKKAGGQWVTLFQFQGPAGADGAAGAPGSQILSGTVDPTDSDGVVGDYYLNETSTALFKKEAGGWRELFTVQGAAGANGAPGVNGTNGTQILSGVGAPDPVAGAEGDYYLDTVTMNLYLKSVEGWANLFSLRTNQWLTGTGLPGAGIGNNGDLYLDIGSGLVYQKANGTWGASIVSFALAAPQLAYLPLLTSSSYVGLAQGSVNGTLTFVAATADGNFLTSTDGVNWSWAGGTVGNPVLSTPQVLTSVAARSRSIVNAPGKVSPISSTVTAVQTTIPTATYLTGLTYFQNQFVATVKPLLLSASFADSSVPRFFDAGTSFVQGGVFTSATAFPSGGTKAETVDTYAGQTVDLTSGGATYYDTSTGTVWVASVPVVNLPPAPLPESSQQVAGAGTAWNDAFWTNPNGTAYNTDKTAYSWTVNWTSLDPAVAENAAAIQAGTPTLVWASVFTSPDGQTWTPAATQSSSNALVLQDAPGISWYLGTVGSTAVAYTNYHLYTSTDGVTWTATGQTPAIGVIRKVIQGPSSAWLAVGQFGVATSTDQGQSWNALTAGSSPTKKPAASIARSPLSTLNLYSAAYGNGTYVVVGQRNDTYQAAILTSTDGLTWSLEDIPSAGALTDIAFGPAGFVATGGNYSAILTSVNGINWTQQGLYGSNFSPFGVLWTPLGGGQYLIASQNNN
jgi:hypothetical protein